VRGLVTVAVVAGLAGTALAQALPPLDVSVLYPTEAAFTRAIEPYQRALAADPRNARAHYWLGVAYLYAYRLWAVGAAPYASGYLPKAVASLSEAIRLNPSLVEAYTALHDAYHLMGEFETADRVIAQMRTATRPAWLPAVPAP
jgi:tetratricopeptide (TPR) repeat protein